MLPPEVIKSIVSKVHDKDKPDYDGIKKAAEKDAARKLMMALQSGSESDFLDAFNHFSEVRENGRDFGDIEDED